MPYPNEHACRLKPPSVLEGFRVARVTKPDGRIFINGFKGPIDKPTDAVTQAVRYPKGQFSADKARADCSRMGGSFEAAKAGATMTEEEQEVEILIEFNLAEPKTHDINDKELVAVGTWNSMEGKVTFKKEDIDAIMESYNDLVKSGIRKIPIKLGHDDKQKLLQKDGYPSAGWVENLRKKTVSGVLKIIGDLKSIPDKVHTIIQNKGYVNVSPELRGNYKYLNTGKKYKWLFNKLALLGIDQPAQDLDELVKAYAKEGSGTDEIVFEMSEPLVTDELKKTKPQPKEEIMPDELKEKYENEINELKTKTEELEAKAKEQEDEKTKLQKSLDEAAEKVKATEEEKKEAAIAAFIDGAIEKGTILPVQKDAYTQILMAMPEDKTYKFTDNEEEKEGNALDLIKSIVETMPDLVKFAEFTEHKEGTTKKDKESDGTPMDNVELATKLEKIQKEEEVSVEDAYRLMEERGEL